MLIPFIKFGAPFAIYLLLLGVHLMVFGKRNPRNIFKFSVFSGSFISVGVLFLLVFTAYYLPDPVNYKSAGARFNENPNNRSYEVLVKSYDTTRPHDLKYQREFINQVHELDYPTPIDLADAQSMLVERYSLLWTRDDTADALVGSYAMGYINYLSSNYEKALQYWDYIDSSRVITGLDAWRAECKLQTGDTVQAIALFHRELRQTGASALVVPRLSNLYHLQQRFDELAALLRTQHNLRYASMEVCNDAFYATGSPGWFIWSVIYHAFAGTNWFSVLAALFISIIYFGYFIKIDVYQPNRKRWLLLMFISGALVSPLVILLRTYLENNLAFLDQYSPVSFLRLLFNPGLVEETVKLLPFLVWLTLVKKVREPVDYIMYAASSALGFAFLENLLYFNDRGQDIIFTRGIISTLFHAVMTGSVAYSILLVKRRKARVVLPWAVFLVAVVLHALFDFLVLEGSPGSMLGLSVLWILGTYMFSLMINNCLNQSPYLTYNRLPDNARIANFLVFSFVYLLMAQFVYVFVNQGRAFAHMRVYQNMVGVGPYLFVLAYCLSNIDIIRGYWERFDPRNMVRKRNRNYCIGKRVAITLHESQGNRLGVSSLSGRIKDRYYEEGEHYFLLVLDHPGAEVQKLLLKPEISFETINDRRPILVGIWASLPDETGNLRLSIMGLGWAKCR